MTDKKVAVVTGVGPGLGAALVRRFADVPIAGARRINENSILQPFLRDLGSHDALGGRRAADVAETDKQDSHTDTCACNLMIARLIPSRRVWPYPPVSRAKVYPGYTPGAADVVGSANTRTQACAPR